jgi:hypothetical protein
LTGVSADAIKYCFTRQLQAHRLVILGWKAR